MKTLGLWALLISLIAAGCAHNPDPAASSTPAAAPPAVSQAAIRPPAPAPLPAAPAAAGTKPAKADEFGDIAEFDETEKGGAERVDIADPLEPFNRAMYHFNDKLYFWFLKPVAQGYSKVVPQPARVGVDNFFSNLAFPVRFVNCLLQANFGGAAQELGRFTINTLFGIGGLLDPAKNPEIDLTKQDEDLGQTLGSYGIGQGFYITWPIFGPSTPRDTLGMAGDTFLRPLSYVTPWYAGAGIRAYGMVNETSLRIGDYEALTGAAIDPYVAIRDAYVQYRQKKVERKGGNPPPPENGGTPKK